MTTVYAVNTFLANNCDVMPFFQILTSVQDPMTVTLMQTVPIHLVVMSVLVVMDIQEMEHPALVT